MLKDFEQRGQQVDKRVTWWLFELFCHTDPVPLGLLVELLSMCGGNDRSHRWRIIPSDLGAAPG